MVHYPSATLPVLGSRCSFVPTPLGRRTSATNLQQLTEPHIRHAAAALPTPAGEWSRHAETSSHQVTAFISVECWVLQFLPKTPATTLVIHDELSDLTL